jgi:tRNA-dihydrouridine synthase B
MNIAGFMPKNNVFLAPMAGVTDKAFRIICKELDCGLVYTEMVSSKGLYYGSKRTELMLDIDDREAPTALQIFGSDPEIMGHMADEVSDDSKVGIIDINMGCPAPKIVKNCDGSALMRNPELAEKIIKNVVLKARKPVTVKIRKGWDDTSINAVEFARMIEASGAAAVTVHGRTRAQFYTGVADWDIIRQVKEAVKIPVIGNGDVVGPLEAKRLLDSSGCDAVMVGRGAMGNPWVFKAITHYLKTGELLEEPSVEERINTALKHLEMAYEFKENKGVIEMRKHLASYIKGMKEATSMRDKINRIYDKDELEKVLIEYREELLRN